MRPELLNADRCAVLPSLASATDAVLPEIADDQREYFSGLASTDGVASALLSTALELTGGGDSRIVCGANGLNRYGCSPVPEPGVLAFGSSTASTISSNGFAAADSLREQLKAASIYEPPQVTYERELNRVRRELAFLCGVENLPGLEIIFGASGTDLHLFASQLIMDPSAPAPIVVRVEAAETGNGVPDALAGRHFSDCAALGDAVVANAPLECGRAVEIVEVKCRNADGTIRAQAEVDGEVEEAVARAMAEGRRVLLTLVDVSKTGILAPSPACADALLNRFANSVEVLVDACQFRLSPSTVRAYVEHGFLVAISGSKFVAGPPFCGALLVPATAALRLRTRRLPLALASYSARADWPRGWAARSALNPVANFGLLLRWQAALTELRAFRKLTEASIAGFLGDFAIAVTQHVAGNSAIELLSTTPLDRGPVAPVKSWDCLPTIFPFLLLRPAASGKNQWLKPGETKKVHELLREDLSELGDTISRAVLLKRCQIGQPVSCGMRDGSAVSALRLCVSARSIVDALSPGGRGIKAVIADAMSVLDKAALLASLPATWRS